MHSAVLTRDQWLARAADHERRVDTWVQPHLARRRAGVAHPVHDFLFTYYSHRPAALRRWHPGYGVTLQDAPEHAEVTGYLVSAGLDHPSATRAASRLQAARHQGGRAAGASERSAETTLSEELLASRRPLITATRDLLVATASRPATLGCFGMHEWAMVYRSAEARHPWPLRLGNDGTDEVVESHRICCSHFDAFRFFTPAARGLNLLQPGREDRADLEQPGCLHAGMDLYKHAFRLSPLVPSELVADAFELAWDIRVLDMRAAPYDLTGLTLDPTGEPWTPVRVETPEGKAEYVAAQRAFAERAAPIRARLVEECDRLLSEG